ncbi:hypothetical protein BGZ89_002902 [Linnemannia elongata]|nr:hypothetical protein BGZ89_002902 [Linnemannia elongata]
MGGAAGTASPPVSSSASPNLGHQATFSPKLHGGVHRDGSKYAPPSPRTFMSLFVDLPAYLITFLEKVSANRWPVAASTNQSTMGANLKTPAPNTHLNKPGSIGSSKKTVVGNDATDKGSISGASRFGLSNEQDMEERKAIWNTLLELYLADPPMASSSGKGQTMHVAELNRKSRDRIIKKEKCMKLLNDTEIPYDTNHALVLCHMAGFDEGIVFLYERMKMYTDILRLWIGRDDTAKVMECLRKYGPQEPSLYPLTLSYFSSSPSRLTSATPDLLKVLDHIDQQDLLPPLQVVQALSQTSVATIGMIKNYIGHRIEAERKERLEDQKQIQSYRQESEKKRREIDDLKTSARIFQVTKCSACGGSLDLPSLEDADDGFEVIAKYFGNNTMAFAKLIDGST